MTPFRLKHLIPTEDQEAQSLLLWARVKFHQGHRLSDLLIMIPNGATLAGNEAQRAMQMAKMKRMGFRKGCSDYFLPVASQGQHGMFLELKRRSLSVTSPEQIAFQQLLPKLGYHCVISMGWEEAKEAIENYLTGSAT